MRQRHCDRIEKLSILALLSAKENLQRIWKELKSKSNIWVTDKTEQRQKLINYHKPYREILARSTLFWKFQDLCESSFLEDTVPIVYEDIKPFNEYQIQESIADEIHFLVWLCFENVETQRLEIHFFMDDFNPYKVRNTEKISYISKYSGNLNNCLELNLTSSEVAITEECYEDLAITFSKLPHLRKLDLCFDICNEVITEKLLPDVISKFQSLTFMEINLLSDLALEAFVRFVENSPKILTVLKVELGILFKGEAFDNAMRAIRNLTRLKHFTLINRSGNIYEPGYIEKDDYPTINFVENVELKTKLAKNLEVIDKFFRNMKSFTLTCLHVGYYYGWDNESLTKLDLENFYNVKCLTLNTSSMKYEFTCAKIFEICPKLEEFHCGNFNPGDLKEMKSLKKFSIDYGGINPPLLLNFPNLMSFSMDWPKEEKVKQIKAVKQYLPVQCKIYENINEEIDL